MQHEKTFNGTVDVPNPINFCADEARHLNAALQKKYAGRCYMGAYVRSVDKILGRGACCVVRTNGTGGAYVDAQFTAKVTVFSRWDILTDVKILETAQMLVGEYNGRDGARAVVAFLASKAVETLTVGQRVAVRIVVSDHPPMQTHASIVGALLVCDLAAPVYRLRGALVLDRAARAELAPMMIAVEGELAARAALVAARKADLWFFELLLCSFRAPAGAVAAPDTEVAAWPKGPVWQGPPAARSVDSAELVSVLDIVRRASAGDAVPVEGIWSRPLALYRSSPLAAVARGPPPADWAAATDSTPRAVFALLLKNVLDFLVATRELAETFASRELIDAHLNVWRVMRAAQRE